MEILTVKRRIIYCETCEREVELKRKDIDQKYNEIMCFLILFTLGIGYILIKYTRKKDTCPYCETKFDLKNLPTKLVKEKKN